MANDKKWQDNLAYILLFAGVALLMIFIGLFAVRSFFMRPTSNKVEIIVSDRMPDTARQSKDPTIIRIDSLIRLVQKHEQTLEKREAFNVQKVEWEKDYQDIVLLLGAFLVAIAAFFGYRSLKDIKEECQGIVKNEVNAYLKDNLKVLMREEIKNTYQDESFRTVAARIETDLVSKHKFITSEILKSSIIDILEDWTISITNKEEKPSDEPGQPDDFDD